MLLSCGLTRGITLHNIIHNKDNLPSETETTQIIVGVFKVSCFVITLHNSSNGLWYDALFIAECYKKDKEG